MHSQFKPSEGAGTEPRLERYLDSLTAPVPPNERAEWRQEAEQHLKALIAAHEELGQTPEEAVEAALRSFGEAQKIGNAVARESKPRLLQRKFTLDPEASHNVCVFVAPVIAISWGLAAAVAGFIRVGDETYLHVLARIAGILLYLCPLVAGWRLGKNIQGTKTERYVLMLSLISVICSLPSSLMFTALQNQLWRVDFLSSLIWIPLGMMATWASWRLRAKRRQMV